MSCSCCFVDNGRNNLVLEITTITISGLFLFLNILLRNRNIFDILCNVGAIAGCGFGIAALKCPQNYRLGYGAVILGVVVFIPYLIRFVIVIIILPELFTSYNSNDMDSPVIPIVFTVPMLADVLFGLSTVLALAVKHYKICKVYESEEGATSSNTVVIGTTTIDKEPPTDQPPASTTPYFPAMHQQQPQQPQSPPSYDYCEKNKADIV